MVLLQKVKATNLQNAARRIPITMTHRREFAPFINSTVIAEREGNSVVFFDNAHRRALLRIEGVEHGFEWHGAREFQRKSKRIDATVFADLPARGSRDIVIKLPSALAGARELATLKAINFDAARATTLDYWSGYVARGAAAARSPLVQLRDHTWIPYVPGEATASGRLLNQWYAADVDTGPVHLLRLKALSPNGDLADSLLHDHEDNLFLNGWGMADEPVYNQQATAYLLRDDPKAAIRAFYSYMASAFSHSVFEPVEHLLHD